MYANNHVLDIGDDANNDVLTKHNHQYDFGTLLTERGTMFGYNDIIVDVRNLVKMRSLNNLIVQDISHANQKMKVENEENMVTSGNSNFIPVIGRAAVAVGVDGLFIETHENSSLALSDRDTQLDIENLENLLVELIDIANVTKGRRSRE